MNSNSIRNFGEHRLRFRVVFPLLLVSGAVVFFSIQDHLREAAVQREERDSTRAVGSTRPDASLRQIPQRRATPSRLALREDSPRVNTIASAEPGDVEAIPDSDVNDGNPARAEIRAVPAPVPLGVALGPGGGAVVGRVTLNGPPPAEREIPLDASCASLVDGKATTRFFIVDGHGGLADVVIALEPVQNGPPLTSPVPVESVLLDQVACEFVPYVLALQVGQRLLVRNSDPVLHNIHITSSGNKELNIAQLPGSPDREFVFEKPEVFLRFKCDVHPWMFAYIALFEHGFFAVTQLDGSFQIVGVPPGDYSLFAVHRKLARATKPVMVRQGEASTVNFTLDVAGQTSP